MEIALDGRLLHRQTSGLERYIRSLVGSLSHRNEQNTYRVYVQWPSWPESEFGPSARLMPVRGEDGLVEDLLNQPCDVFHAPWLGYSVLHFLPLRIARASVVTVPDLILFHHPEYLPESMRARYRALLTECVKWADAVAVYSEHTKSDIIRNLGVPDERISVIPLGIAAQFQQPPNRVAAEWVRRKYGIDRSYILHIGKDYPHKNLSALAQAFIRLKSSSLPNHQLVLAGESVWHETRTQLHYLFNSAGVSESVLFLDHVLDDDLPTLYQAADVFVFPSLYEGFGLPPLEAMACGTPVVCSDGTSLPEVTGDAAVVVNAADVGALAAGIRQAALNSDVRRTLIKAGLRQASRFSWESTAAGTARTYEQAVELAQQRRKARVPSNWAIHVLSSDLASIRSLGTETLGETSDRVTLLIVNVAPPLAGCRPAVLQAKWLYHRYLLARLTEAVAGTGRQVRLIDLASLADSDSLPDIIDLLRPKAILLGGLVNYGDSLTSLLETIRQHNPSTPVFVAEDSLPTGTEERRDGAISLLAENLLDSIIASGLREVLEGSGLAGGDSADRADLDAYGLSLTADLALRLGVPEPLAVVASGQWPDGRDMEFRPAGLSVRRDPGGVIQEVAELRNRGSAGAWLVVDADLFTDRPWADEFVRQCRSQGLILPLACLARASSIVQGGAEVLASLKSIGLDVVLMLPDRALGEQSLAVGEAVASTEQERRYAEAAALLRRCGVRVCASYVLGGPGRGIEDVVATVRLVQGIRPDIYDPVVHGKWDYAPPAIKGVAAHPPNTLDESFLCASAVESCRQAGNHENSVLRAIELRHDRDETEQALRRQFEQSLEQSRVLLASYRERCSHLEAQVETLQIHLRTLVGLLSPTGTADHEVVPPLANR